ncbi:two-component response regulator-like PRR73 [Impatiens glandulifera]|uniref:two-component response regulator-like PRR73 n=1 Tax=Impatiens glandulifera TaxID=253017 RepID=UPI001FB05978|nr:two-component response regulator-like PRR73 [Impatiens glandulifera]XP_047324670.1 two-component response regulator-like PRR73 [Impatiens glandulifera]
MEFADRVDANGPETKGLAARNHLKLDDRREIRGGITGDGQGLSEEDESRVNGDTERGKGGSVDVTMGNSVQKRSFQQSQGPVVHWERFLPLGSLKVLLVENDDSTRHVVSALLRNCSYEAVAVSNGMEAWNILTDPTTHIDLVLTEISMPSLSGIGLLSKIMNHKSCKNLPVIMMSSNDSMGIVFKCLSNGAVDFLVKPIRKNELKNLWQHVWRKYHSSSCSGSGSESGVRIQKSVKSNTTDGSNNKSDSNEEDDIGSIGLNVRDGSDNGSGTQSSWTKRAVEVDSPQPMSPPDSTCAQVIHSRPEEFCNNRVPVTSTIERHGEECNLDDGMEKDLEIKTTSTPAEASNIDQFFILESGKDGKEPEKGKLEKNDTINGKIKKKSGDEIVASVNRSDSKVENLATAVESNVTKMNIKGKNVCCSKDMPSHELNLKRMKDAEENGLSTIDRNVFKHSDLSAFSRYNTISITNLAPTGNVGSCSPLDHSSEVAKIEMVQNFQSNSNGTPNQGSNESCNNNDMGSTTNNIKSLANSVVKLHPCSTFDPAENPPLTAPKDNMLVQERGGMNQQVQVQHHHHHYHHHHHHVHGSKQQQLQFLNHDNMSLKNPNASKTPREGNAANYTLNGSGSGSNNGSDGQNGSSDQIGSSTAIIHEGGENKPVAIIDNGVAGIGAVGAITANGSSVGFDKNGVNGLTQREAALNKFRQKRKDRCFEKKVRYQSRKRLAEQRPRIRGQFVRQIVAHENESNEEDG